MSGSTADDKALAELLVARGFLAPTQANQVLKLLRETAATGKPTSLQDVILKHRVLSPRRWKDFEKSLKTQPPGGGPA